MIKLKGVSSVSGRTVLFFRKKNKKISYLLLHFFKARILSPSSRISLGSSLFRGKITKYNFPILQHIYNIAGQHHAKAELSTPLHL